MNTDEILAIIFLKYPASYVKINEISKKIQGDLIVRKLAVIENKKTLYAIYEWSAGDCDFVDRRKIEDGKDYPRVRYLTWNEAVEKLYEII